MREDNLLAIENRELPRATDRDYQFEIYLNLPGRLKICGTNQLWIADIIYVRLKTEFVYLAVILDAFSRKVLGWSLDRTLQARLPVGALKQAIANRQPPPGLVHHSDRGVQYASEEYIEVLRDHGMIPSMSRPGHLHDNASCESFMKTLKREEIRPLLQSVPPTFGSWLTFAGRVRGTIKERKRGYRLGGGNRRLFQVLRTNFNQVRKPYTQDSVSTKGPTGKISV